MDELGLFFKLLSNRGLVQKAKSIKGSKKSKARLTTVFFVSDDGGKVDEPVVIWRSKIPCCFSNLKDPSRPRGVHYSNNKAWMNGEIMSEMLSRLDRKMRYEGRNVILFMDNASSHLDTLGDNLSNIKIIFLPKNTTSRLQPLDAGIIRAFESVYRKTLVRYVVTRIDDDKRAADIIKEIDVLRVIGWIKSVWKEVAAETIKHCFEKCVFSNGNYSIENYQEENDDEFLELLETLNSDCSLDEYINLDNNITTSEERDTSAVDWIENLRQECIDAVVDKTSSTTDDLSGNDDDSVIVDMDSPHVISAKLALELSDKEQQFEQANSDETLLTSIHKSIEIVEKMNLANLKQRNITDFFQKK